MSPKPCRSKSIILNTAMCSPFSAPHESLECVFSLSVIPDDSPLCPTDGADGPVPVSTLPGVLLHPNGSLSIPSAGSLHRGLYACRASNGVGAPLVARPQLTIYGEVTPDSGSLILVCMYIVMCGETQPNLC